MTTIRAFVLALLMLAPTLARADGYSANNFILWDYADPSKNLMWNLTGLSTGSPVVWTAAPMSGLVVLEPDEGAAGDFFISGGGLGNSNIWRSPDDAGVVQATLTADRVPFALSAHVLGDDADLKFKADSLTATKINNQSLRVQTSVLPGGGMQHCRVNTGTIGAGSTAQITVTWGVAFADTNYTVVAQVEDATASSLSLSVVHIDSRTATDCKIRVLNNALLGLVGLLHVIGLHD